MIQRLTQKHSPKKAAAELRLQLRDIAKAQGYGFTRMRSVMAAIQATIIRNAIENKQNFSVGEFMSRNKVLREAFADTLLVSYALGRLRALDNAGIKKRPITFDLKSDVLPTFAGADSDYLRRLRAKFDTEAFTMLKNIGDRADITIRNALVAGLNEGEHFEGLRNRVAGAMQAFGITPDNSYTIENVVRTQTAISFQAGKWNAENKDPDILEILWGYRYTTIGDDRVRQSHELLDGITLPRTDSFWETHYPPNGYSCRCQAVAIFDPDTVEQLPIARAEIPAPDQGFNFNPGALFTEVGRPQEGLVLPPPVKPPGRRVSRVILPPKPKPKPAPKPAPKVVTPLPLPKPKPIPKPAPVVVPEKAQPLEVTTDNTLRFIDQSNVLDVIKEYKVLDELHSKVVALDKDGSLSKLSSEHANTSQGIRNIHANYQKALADQKKILKQWRAANDARYKIMDKFDTLEERDKSEEYQKAKAKYDALQAKIHEQDKKINDLADAHNREYKVYQQQREQIDKVTATHRESLLNICGVPADKQTKILLNSVGNPDVEVVSKAFNSVQFLSKLIGKRPARKDAIGNDIPAFEEFELNVKEVDLKKDPDGRCFYRESDNSIYCHKTTKESVYVHEVAHAIEVHAGRYLDENLEQVSPVYQACDAFRRARIAKAGTKDVNMLSEFGGNYDAGEYGNEDGFLAALGSRNSAAYAGKAYKGLNSTEILTMGIQYIHENPSGFAKADPEFFKFIIGILRGDLERKP